MFDFENMQSKFQEERRNLNAFRERLRARGKRNRPGTIDVGRVCLDGRSSAAVVSIKTFIQRLLDLRDAIQHVPNNIPRIVNGISLRLSFIFKIFKSFKTFAKKKTAGGNYELFYSLV